MINPVSIIISAIGGYGYYYLKTLFEDIDQDTININGVIDPLAKNSGLYDEVVQRKIPVYNEIKE